MVERILSGRFCPLTAPFPFRRPPAPAPLSLRSHAVVGMGVKLYSLPHHLKLPAHLKWNRNNFETVLFKFCFSFISVALTV